MTTAITETIVACFTFTLLFSLYPLGSQRNHVGKYESQNRVRLNLKVIR